MSAGTVRANDVLSRRLDVSFRQTPVKTALSTLAQQGQFEYSYNASILDPERRITLLANDWTVREILQEILGPGYQFKTNGSYVIIKRQRGQSDELSGYLRDPQTGQRLANATVYDKRTLRATTTDSSGFYQLKVKKRAEIVVAKLGYRDTVLQVESTTQRYQQITLARLPIDTTPAPKPTDFQVALQETANEMERLFNATLDQWHTLNVRDSLHRHFQISLLPQVGSNHVLSGKVENDWSLNLLAGQSAAVRRLEVAGLANFTRREVTGIQAAGLFNLLRGNCEGVQLAGLYNRTGDTLQGVQVAGMGNFTRKGVAGAQVAGLFNVSLGNCEGVQVAGTYNRTADTLRGVQVSGLLNFAGATSGSCLQMSGLVNSAYRQNSERVAQASGLVNLAQRASVQIGGALNFADNVRGAQAAVLINQADTLSGVQVGGMLNRTKHLRGLQIGVFNWAEDVQGLQIGLINRSGRRVLPFVNW